MQSAQPPKLISMPLEDFGQLQARYQGLPLANRAGTVLKDAAPALQAAEHILQSLSSHPDVKQLFASVRKNSMLIGKMRPSEAKNMLMDSSCDFIEGTLHKLAAWKKTMERISSGESISKENGKEFIPNTAPLALAIIGSTSIGNYLSVVQLALMELSKKDTSHATTVAEMRRCSTVLSDYENACGIDKIVH